MDVAVRGLILCLGLLAAWSVHAAPDPRVLDADAALADASRYGEAIELYSAYLQEHPEDAEVRIRLARVLAWRSDYEASLAAFDRVLESEDRLDVAVERAEVLSWAGRYAEAERAFEAVLARDSENVRATLGLARVHRWAGRHAEADRVYGRALELGADAEAATERAALQELYPPTLAGHGAMASDDDGYAYAEGRLEASGHLNLRARLTARLAAARVEGTLPRAGGGRNDEQREGRWYALGGEYLLSRGVLLSAEVGHEIWDDAPDQVIGGARLQLTPSESTSLELRWSHEGVGRHVQSLHALDAGVARDEVDLSVWRDLPGPFDIWARGGGGRLSDGNARAFGEASLSWSALESPALSFHLGTGAAHHADESPRYYDPSWSAQSQVEARYAVPRFFGVGVSLSTSVGYAASRESGLTTDGLIYGVSSTLRAEWRRFAIEVAGSFNQSRRRDVYQSERVGVALSRSF